MGILKNIFYGFIVIAFLVSSVRQRTSEICNISIDLGSTVSIQSIVWPFEQTYINEEGGMGLRIAPKVGRGWLGEAGGEATYSFYVPSDATYYTWAYVNWYDDCTNAVFMQIDGFDKAIIGNDPIYQKWHWVKGYSLKLSRGTHLLHLSNHSDNIALQKIFLTNVETKKPSDVEVVFSDIFYDGFDGCDQGNFSQWGNISGEWYVSSHPTDTSYKGNILIGKSQDESEIIFGSSEWSNYVLDISLNIINQLNLTDSLKIVFFAQDEINYYALRYIKESSSRMKIELLQQKEGTDNLLYEVVYPWNFTQWHIMSIGNRDAKLMVKIDNYDRFVLPISEQLRGQVGIILQGKIEVYFDNVHVRSSSK